MDEEILNNEEDVLEEDMDTEDAGPTMCDCGECQECIEKEGKCTCGDCDMCKEESDLDEELDKEDLYDDTEEDMM